MVAETVCSSYSVDKPGLVQNCNTGACTTCSLGGNMNDGATGYINGNLTHIVLETGLFILYIVQFTPHLPTHLFGLVFVFVFLSSGLC